MLKGMQPEKPDLTHNFGETMHILKMEDEQLDDVVKVDRIAFERYEPRIKENFRALKLSDPDGCFVVLDKDEVVGYSYSKVLGREGYLGPLVLLPSYQNEGYGKVLVSKNLEYLESHCDTIGLEVLPEHGGNIGLYSKIGFISGFPSLLFELPGRFELSRHRDLPNHFKSHHQTALQEDLFQFKLLSGVPEIHQEKIIQEIDSWIRNSFNGVSYSEDLKTTLDLKGLVLVAFHKKEPVGFLAYSKTLLPYLWGTVKLHEAQNEIMMGMLINFIHLNEDERVIVQVNSRYADLVDLLISLNFKVFRSVNRMLWRGYEGNYLKISNEMVMRGWRG
jgi:Acetyltransferases